MKMVGLMWNLHKVDRLKLDLEEHPAVLRVPLPLDQLDQKVIAEINRTASDPSAPRNIRVALFDRTDVWDPQGHRIYTIDRLEMI